MAEPTQPTDTKPNTASSTAEVSTQNPPEAAIEDDSDPDFDDLDDVLDQFSSAKAINQQPKSEPLQPTPSSSGPGRPALPQDLSIPSGPQPNESEEEFMARLTAEMSSVMSKMSADPAANAATPEDVAKMGRELEEFTQKMEAEGIQPEDLLKAILGEDVGGRVGDMAHEEKERRESESNSRSKSTGEKSKSRSPETSRVPPSEDRPTSSSSTKAKQPPSSFESTIARTMALMSESSAAATTASSTTTAQQSEEALLADLLRGIGDGSGEGEDDGELSKMFLGMMEQLTNKEMLYEPMKELSTKFPEWLRENAPTHSTTTTSPPTSSKKSKAGAKLSQPEFERFTRQEKIVQDLVSKFEEKGYSDDDPKCREYIWEKMQEMQGEGAPPEELIANPFPGMGGLGGLGGAGEEGCPTQ